ARLVVRRVKFCEAVVGAEQVAAAGREMRVLTVDEQLELHAVVVDRDAEVQTVRGVAGDVDVGVEDRVRVGVDRAAVAVADDRSELEEIVARSIAVMASAPAAPVLSQ